MPRTPNHKEVEGVQAGQVVAVVLAVGFPLPEGALHARTAHTARPRVGRAAVVVRVGSVVVGARPHHTSQTRLGQWSDHCPPATHAGYPLQAAQLQSLAGRTQLQEARTQTWEQVGTLTVKVSLAAQGWQGH